MSDFEKQVQRAAEQAVLKFVGSGDWLVPNYQDRLKVPPEWIAQCWGLIDAKKVQAQVSQLIEKELAERIVGAIAAEISTDIKQILSVKERRETIRALARDNIEAIMSAGSRTN